MPRASKEQSEATARRVLATATTLFAERGYAAVGLEEVAAAADVTRGAVYHHYAGKMGLFEAVADAVAQRVGSAVAAAADAEPDPWAGLLAGCRAFLAAGVTDDTRRILLIDAPAVLGWQTWHGQDARASARHLQDAIEALAARGDVRVHSAAGTAALLSGAMNEAALRIAAAPDPASELEILWRDLERLLSGLRPHALPDGADGHRTR
ncbi:TetR/AcrR family transcriptional regulator [Cryptosporangium minutisporangium]|uniref:TetR/AcrR family transcriptional regulator n=1 Tax=Cryptosporangium minutisporangium TaxID=113569 RepID=A0ABP6SSD4_9ACTN